MRHEIKKRKKVILVTSITFRGYKYSKRTQKTCRQGKVLLVLVALLAASGTLQPFCLLMYRRFLPTSFATLK